MYVWTTLALERYKKEEEEFEASLGYMSPCIKREGKKKKEKEVEEERSVSTTSWLIWEEPGAPNGE